MTVFCVQVTVGSHTFNMPGRVRSTQEAEQKAAYISLLGLCMTDSKAAYHPEGVRLDITCSFHDGKHDNKAWQFVVNKK